MDVGRLEQVRANLRRAYLAGRATVSRPDEPEDEPPVIVPPPSDVPAGDDQHVPYPLRIAAAWSWRVLVVAAAAVALLWAVGRLHQVVVPVAISLLLAALLSPMVGFLRKRVRMNRSLATAIVMTGGLALVVGTLTVVISQFVDSWPKLSANAQAGLHQVSGWLKRGPLHLSDQQLNSVFDAANQWIRDHRSTLTTGALSTAGTALDVLAALFLVLFTTFFFLRDGRRIWRFLVRLLPAAGREPLGSAGEQSWQTLVAYVRATVLVAFIDAVGIGTGLVLLRVDLAFPLAALVFLGAFIPIIGATLSGTVAILVALVTRGPLIALLVLLVVVGVQQLEGHVLQPAIMGKAVAIHPLAVIMAIATGVVLAGLVGALVAVPITAVFNTGIRHLAARRHGEPEPAPPEDVVVRS
jgi:putative heme transporter